MRMIVSGNLPGRRALACGGLLAALAFAPAAHALELRDMEIRFEPMRLHHDRKSDGSVYRGEPSKGLHFLTAIAGTIVMPGTSSMCHEGGFSLVYKPGAHAGTARCPLKRVGTATDWTEYSGEASFTTNTIVSGNVVTLQGTMEARGTYTRGSCGDTTRMDMATRITQSLKIRIVGRTCQILQFESVEVQTDTKNSAPPYDRVVNTTTKRGAPGMKCTLTRPSERPATPPSKEGLASVRSSC